MRDGDYEFTVPHFFEEMADDDLIFADIERVIATEESTGDSPATHEALDLKYLEKQRMIGMLPSFAGSKKVVSCFS